MIECVHVLGWQCVGNKGEFQVGDKCVYMEVDSFLPVCDEFEFLRDTSFKQDEVLGAGFRLKTRKFRGQISQGLVQPLSILPEGEYQVGDDVTEILGIRKWEVGETVLTNGTVLHRFPGDIPKTNELRVQSYPELIDEFKKVKGYYISTKMDGTSVTMYWKDGHFGVCGRNYEYVDNEKCAMWIYAHKHSIPEKVAEHHIGNIAIQGEFCGAGIQRKRLRVVCDPETGKAIEVTEYTDPCHQLKKGELETVWYEPGYEPEQETARLPDLFYEVMEKKEMQNHLASLETVTIERKVTSVDGYLLVTFIKEINPDYCSRLEYRIPARVSIRKVRTCY